MGESTFVVHGHFYQPPRENPWTETVTAEPSAAPFHDWNERIAAESYRPNGWARIVDDRGRVVAIVDNYAHLSFDVGPTLAAWLAEHQPDVLARMVEGDRLGGGAMAQAYNHVILPLATERDVRTQVRWG
ncbi:MAG: glycoside hydrolase, partial [Acidimicrobiia bacterium]